MDRINQYFASPRVSNSFLKLLENPRLIKLKQENPEIEDDDKSFFRLGAAVDCLLTSPERFKDDFIIVNVNRPYGLMGKFVDKLPAGLTPASPIEDYVEAYNHANYKMSIDWVVSKFWGTDQIVDYYNSTVNIPKSIIVLSKDEAEKVQKVVELIAANVHTTEYFYNTDPNVELVHQVPIYFTHMGVECKALLDGVMINHVRKEIQPFDLKTTGMSVYSFPENFVRFGYYRQAAFYTQALLSKESPIVPLLEDGYKLLPFKFIVAETKPNSYHPAVIYNCTDNDIKVGLDGGYYNGRRVKGVNELLQNYLWHKEHDLWDLPRELYVNNGEISLDVFSSSNSNEQAIYI